MIQTSRDRILEELKAAPKGPGTSRPSLPPLRELGMAREALLQRFKENLEAQTGVFRRVETLPGVLDALTEVIQEENIKQVMTSTDDVIASLDLAAWGRSHDIEVFTQREFKERRSFTDAVFDKVQAGITGADFAVAESGTLVLVHHQNQARLVSLAPVVHIAVVPVERIVPTYEKVVEDIYADDRRPSQVSWITGPSMTADIQATPFKGMHGPRRVIVIVVG
jgi:L-lactate dehydrogenase complex protein LldG